MDSRRRISREDSKRRQTHDDASPSISEESDRHDSSPRRRSSGRSRERSRSSKRSRRRDSSESDDSPDDSDDHRIRKNKKGSGSSKKISEEKIAEYLAKKAQKKAMKVAKKLKTQTAYGYANDLNPFGDSNLNEKFVWKKKIERDVTQGVPLDMFSIKAEKKRQKERMVVP